MKHLYRRGWIESVKKFQSSSKEEQNKYCGYCGCGGGCDLCNNISSIKEEDILDDDIYDIYVVCMRILLTLDKLIIN